MIKTIVGIDVETTSLEPETGDIIEVAAIKFDKETGEELARLVQLCQPTQDITDEIVSLTGITNEMVADKPAFKEIAQEVTDFIQDDLIFAHNASFDVAWLSKHGVKLPAPTKVWDTFHLASIAWPTAESYNLGTLMDILGLNEPVNKGSEHRAGDDVIMTHRLFRALQKKLAVSASTHQQISAILERSDLLHYQELFTIANRKEDNRQEREQEKSYPPLKKPTAVSKPHSFFSAKGPLSSHLPQFKERKGQVMMAEKIEQVLQAGGKALIEAPTGTGKTLAYLLPAVRVAADNRVLISTYTKHLQDQLLEEDLPTIFAALGGSVKVASLKGRSNYICSARLNQILNRASFQPTDALLLLKILVWLDQGGRGEIDELNTSHQESWVLEAMHADALSCRQGCPAADNCYYQQARARAEKARLVILNHSLLAKISAGLEQSLPAQAIIIDEGHHLEEAVRGSTKLNLSSYHLAELLAPIVKEVKNEGEANYRHIHQETSTVRAGYEDLLNAMEKFLLYATAEDRLRLTSKLRQQSGWKKVLTTEKSFQTSLKFLFGLIEGLDSANSSSLLRAAVAELHKFGLEVHAFVEGSNERIQWLEKDTFRYGDKAKLSLVDVALAVGMVMEPIYSQAKSLVVTSATLKTGDSWQYIENRLGFAADVHLTVPSPFNLPQNMLIYLVNDGPKPGNSAFDDFVRDILVETSLTLEGKTMALFTSLKSIKEVYQKALPSLNKAKIKLYAQGLTGGRRNMLRRFRAEDRSVLLGANSFWEGVDIPGETLSAVIIPKLPFSPPYDPITDALAEAEERDAFRELSLPQMILTLRQGIGRLLRNESDRGAIIILDPRLQQSSYGEEVLASLPTATVKASSTKLMSSTLKEWFATEQNINADKQ